MSTDIVNEIVLHSEPPASPPLLLIPPRPLWIEFLLHFCTFGLYTSYWFMRRMQEFKRIYATDSRPWLWIFVPLVVVAQLFALPKFVALLNRFEHDCNISEWRAWRGGWYVLVILLTIGFNVAEKYEFPWWFLPAGMFAWAALFTAIQARIDNVKRNQINYGFFIRRHVLAIPEMIILLVMVPACLYLLFVISKDHIFDSTLEKFDKNSVYVDNKNHFKLLISSEGWKSVEKGTHSTGDAILELQGAFPSIYFVIFSHSIDSTLSDIAFARQNEIVDSTPSSECKQLREFSASGESVVAKVVCTSSMMTNRVLEIVTVIETSTGVIEMYGSMNMAQKSFDQYKADFEKMSSGLEAL